MRCFLNFGSGSSKAKRGPLIVPGKRQTGVLEELLRREIARVAAIEDRLGYIRREIAEADETSEIGPADTFLQHRRGSPSIDRLVPGLVPSS